MTWFDEWHTLLRDIGEAIENDQRFPDRMEVLTPFHGGVNAPAHDLPPHDPEAGFAGSRHCRPHWRWVPGRIIGQSDPNHWFVFIEHEGRSYLVHRHIFDLLPTNPLDD